MPLDSPSAAAAPRPIVFLPCHTLDDFPTWLGDREADDLLAAWTAAWHPRLVADRGMPRWASVDLPPGDVPAPGIVPATWDDRFAAQFDARSMPDARLVRATRGRGALAGAALAAIGATSAAEAWVDDFQALGLAVLLAELLARRMRTAAGLESTGFADALAAAASAAVGGRDDDVRAGLVACFGCLEASRARYYPVDAWLVDLVLVAPSTSTARLRDELAAPVPLGIVAEGRWVAALADRDPGAAADLRRGLADGRIDACGGPLVDRPVDLCTPEEILEMLGAGAAAWHDAVGCRPAVFARYAGGGSAMLPQALAGLGYEGAVWNTFDGGPLPDPGAGRILWEGTGSATIEALARPPLDARGAAAILALPERLGDAMDHDHVAVVTFAHHAGTASEWHRLLRRIGAWSTVLGTFVTPGDLLRRTAGGGTTAAFGPDAFPPSTPPSAGDGDPVAAAVEGAVEAATRLLARARDAGPIVPPRQAAPASKAPVAAGSGGVARALASWWAGARRDDPDLVLVGESIRVEVHPETGGILSLRRPGAGPNRLSQQIAPRDLAGYGRMRADSVGRVDTAAGPRIVSRGRLIDAAGREAGRFEQGLALVPGMPLVTLDIDVRGDGGPRPAEPLAERHLACRFAWHENEDVEIRRSVHGQAVPTERTRFTAPHFIEIVPAGLRAAPDETVTILCGGLPWHARSLPHVLDTILAAPGGTAARRLAVGIGVERPWDAALELLAGAMLGSGPRLGPENVRVSVQDVEFRAGAIARARIAVLESAGRAGRVRVEWAADVAAAAARELDGRPRPGSDVAIEGRAVLVFLRAYEWLAVDLEFKA